MADPLLVTRNLNKSFGALAASKDLCLDIQTGELHALIGPNGAGKTTAIAQLAGEITPNSGSIQFAGHDITRLPIHARVALGLARSFQITSVFERFTVIDNVAMAIQARQGHSFRFWRNARRDKRLQQPASAVLERLGLAEQAQIPTVELAHGEKRQLEVAMALACKPQLLLLDEPMAGIGPGGTRELSALLKKLKGSVTILLVEHDMDVVFALADRITVLAYGEAIATGSPAEIRADSRVRQAYLGED